MKNASYHNGQFQRSSQQSSQQKVLTHGRSQEQLVQIKQQKVAFKDTKTPKEVYKRM